MFEWPALSQETFDALLPFSLVTDEQGIVLRAGRSVAVLHSGSIIGKHFTELGTSTSLLHQPEMTLPGSLLGEILRLRMAVNPEIILRGQVVRTHEKEPLFIFSLQPSISSTKQLTSLGFTIADFDLGTPIIDLLMLLHTDQITQAKLREANSQLKTDAQMSVILQTITTLAFCTEHTEQLYQLTLDAVCRNLGWDIGHIFFIRPNDPHMLTSSPIWHLSDKSRYRLFVDATQRTDWSTTKEFPADVPHRILPLWVSDYARSADSVRGSTLPSGNPIRAVAVAIRVADQPVAVLEFISLQAKPFHDTQISFFALLAGQLGRALAHHEAARKERDRLTQLAAASKMATLGELAAGVAHEIKNPLSTLSLIARIISKMNAVGAPSPDQVKEQLGRIELCVERIADIVRKLTDFSRESSEDPFTSVQVQKVLSDVIGLAQARFIAHGVKLHVVACPEDWRLDCRPSQVSQILLNLLSNAFDAVVECAERWVTLECHDAGETFLFIVSDSGPGIPPEVRDKIMAPFFTTKPPGLGVGLGLSISAHLATQHRGSLRLDGSSSHTRFILELPKRQHSSAMAAA